MLGLGFRVLGFGFGVKGFGFRVVGIPSVYSLWFGGV